ncbi:hypothetical protein CLV84_2630 [Neolewinella xylanilytica]|uniref:NfeD-like C-terminal domain-containing protein n=1 Tax=Neolewinella xylanilytica TaxID=1514080 RepID=A0A2S6I3G8_9BACT|nr:hypothetical protein [Neolewinella xylanilytica]PPK85726.1 hypothetical protein CLV84_2630 [Neolewinella xylanilytica]
MVIVLTYISLIAGGLLIVLLLAGIFGGMDFDVDADVDGEAAVGMGGVGIIKGALTFLSVGSWAARLLLITSSNPFLSLLAGLAAGAVAVYLLSLVVSFLLNQEADVNWQAEDTLQEVGQVYLRIPAQGEGIVRVAAKGGIREMKARSRHGLDLPTGTMIIVEECTPEGMLVVSPTEPMPHSKPLEP